MSSYPDPQAESLVDAFREVLDGAGGLCTRFVAVVEYVDQAGQREVFTVASPGATRADKLGLLHYALELGGETDT